MSPATDKPKAEYRSIVLLCQECGGDLTPEPVPGSARCRFRCRSCHALVAWAGVGWVRAEA